MNYSSKQLMIILTKYLTQMSINSTEGSLSEITSSDTSKLALTLYLFT